MNPDLNFNTIVHQDSPLPLILLSAEPSLSSSLDVSKEYFLAKKLYLVLVPGEKAIIPLILNLR